MTNAKTLAEKFTAICDEVFDRWNDGQRSGKLLGALSGRLPSYRADVTAVRTAISCHDGLIATLERAKVALTESANVLRQSYPSFADNIIRAHVVDIDTALLAARTPATER